MSIFCQSAISPSYSTGARFSKFPKLFGRISGDIILLKTKASRDPKPVILNFIPFTTYEKTSFTEYAGRSFTNGFSGVSRNSSQLLKFCSQLLKQRLHECLVQFTIYNFLITFAVVRGFATREPFYLPVVNKFLL